MMQPADIVEGTDQVLEDLGHTPTRVHSRGRLSWAVAPGLISGDRVGVSA